ncbi:MULTISPECIES: acetyl-CoA carboxylase biotin carboxyl carrier protein [unclassified Microbispora]|uniref:acetyl-CoA carboxylase biotin carboxyl carrier protein n=1 Tax=unclassified Microbispora TaxID=2614687 RepID=UPI0014765824|nr:MULTISPECIES: acetyl-CoA carboxylase biotin carboxyl carrier protein [unclassified Microbispora]
MDFDLEELASIIELLDKADFRHFRFEKGDLRITVSRDGNVPLDLAAPTVPPPAAVPGAPVQAAPASAAPAPLKNPAKTPLKAPAQAAAEPDEGEIVITAPLLGTFYRSPKPGEPPYVEIGDKVEPDSVLCIVEVMKLMNSVPAGVSGEVTKVFAGDGELVEYGSPLFAVRPAA